MLFLFITLSSFFMAFSVEDCITKSPCKCVTSDNQVIDLSSVGRPDYPRFYEVAFENYTALYSYNPCYPFNSIDKQVIHVPENKKPCFGAAACIRTPGKPDSGLPEEYMIGLQSSATFNTADDGIYIEYSVSEPKSTVTVWLLCDEKIKEHVLALNSTTDDSTVFHLTSKCACLNGCSSTMPVESPPGLSVGSKLLIAFFTILLAYFIVGIFWNYCNGSKGIELIPNIEFWNDLPTLIMEGVSFVCSCCSLRQSSYGEV